MKTLVLLACALGMSLGACATLPSEQPTAALPLARIYQRATNEFTEAAFFKPAEGKTNNPGFALAPLILQEIPSRYEPAPQPGPSSTLSLSNVFWQIDTVQVHGKPHTRFAYLWRYPGSGFQGVRLTLNSTGQPVIWEVLTDSSGASVTYISQNLEGAAAAEFGKPLPGRRYVIERSLADAPNLVVARVLDDGPVAMGPIVYLSAGTGDVSTLICRCMPAQARKLRATSSYDLLPCHLLLVRLPDTLWPLDQPPSRPIEDRLRLPSAF